MCTHGLIMYRHVIGSLAGPGQFLATAGCLLLPIMGGPRGAVAGRDLLTRIPNRGFGPCVSSLSVRFAGHELRSEQEVAVCSRRLGVFPAPPKGTDGADSADHR